MNLRKISILHLRNCRGITTLTGPETYLLDLLSYIDKARFNLRLAFTEDSNKPASLFLRKLANRHINYKSIPTTNRFQLRDLRYLMNQIKTQQIDLLNTHDARSGVIGLLASKLTHTPLVSFAHGWVNWENRLSKDRLYASLESSAISHADYIIVGSRHMMDLLLTRGIPEWKINHIPIGIDTNRFRKISNSRTIRHEYQIATDTPLIGTVCRIHPWKGQRHFIEAAARVHRSCPEVKFLIVGDVAYPGHNQYKQQLIDLRDRLNLKNTIIFTGSRKDIPSVMNALDVFVLPSLVEPFGIVLLEAQACGVPVIATSVGGIPETISVNHTGMLVKPGNADELADAILTLLRKKKRAIAMGEAGRERIEKYFSAVAMAKKTESLYTKIFSIKIRK